MTQQQEAFAWSASWNPLNQDRYVKVLNCGIQKACLKAACGSNQLHLLKVVKKEDSMKGNSHFNQINVGTSFRLLFFFFPREHLKQNKGKTHVASISGILNEKHVW